MITGIGVISTLRDVREKVLGFTFDGAVRLSGIREQRMQLLECDPTEMTVWESERLASLYGLDAEIISASPIRVPREEAVATLGCVDEFRSIGDATRAAVVRAAMAVRDVATLRELLGVEKPAFPRIQIVESDPPWADGKMAAEQTRNRFGPGVIPISSMRDWVRDYLPGVALLYAHLTDDGPSGLTFAGPGFGPALVVNLDGKNTNPCVRRFSLAHEVYHLLVDWDRVEPLATLSGYLEDRRFRREQRANSFATRFLCPEREVSALPTSGVEATQELILKWGLHYSAARLYIQNTRNIELPPMLPSSIHATGAEANWHAAEKPDGVAGFPLRAAPPERRTVVARMAAEAYAAGKFPRDRFAELLGVTPAENVERVLDFFGFDPPASYAA